MHDARNGRTDREVFSGTASSGGSHGVVGRSRGKHNGVHGGVKQEVDKASDRNGKKSVQHLFGQVESLGTTNFLCM